MFEKYLKSFKSSGFSRVVLGNTTADLDSTLGSILLAYLFTCNGTPSIPLVNQEKRLFLKQFDTLTLMKKYTKIEPGNLQFKEEVDLIDKELVLYDHNSVDREELSDLVVGVVDHHEDHGMNYKNLRFKEIVYSGSCISLVAQKLLKSQLMTTEMREMIELTLIHDTYNFGENMYIGLDQEVYDKIKLCADGRTIWEDILQVKFSAENNCDDLAVLLERDFKRFGISSGFSSVNIGFKSEKQSLAMISQIIEQFCVQKGLDTLLILTHQINETKKIRRELLLYSASDVQQAAVILQKLGYELVQQLNLLQWYHEPALAVSLTRKDILQALRQ